MLAVIFSISAGLSCGDSVNIGPSADDTGEMPPPDPDPETICDDGLDNDNDGLFDCDDDDCAEVFHCTWPDEIENDVSIQFDASSIAEIFGYDDCAIQTNSALANDTVSACPTCDRSYTGALVYTADSCPADAFDRPTSVTYGVNFLSDTERVFLGEEEAAWVELATVSASKDGAYRYSTVQPVEVDGIDAGDVTIVLVFTDR
jgi:hypothetical protein